MAAVGGGGGGSVDVDVRVSCGVVSRSIASQSQICNEGRIHSLCQSSRR